MLAASAASAYVNHAINHPQSVPLMTSLFQILMLLIDVAFFIVNQYVLPTAAIPDVGMALLRQQSPLLYPLSGTIFAFAMTGMFISLYRQHCQSRFWLAAAWRALMQTLRGAIYMIHWLVVMPCTTGRMSIRPKRLKWVKTTHQGGGEDLEPSYTELG
ncbi:MAG: hypothetical protein HC838_17390 [Spirulinaceae cyanobacterium RM2_2_10]|nr:hypothetical protein [Spirulinaceae cyanobacterium RM2_2_10]